jgi:hypothetical protein
MGNLLCILYTLKAHEKSSLFFSFFFSLSVQKCCQAYIPKSEGRFAFT